MICIYIFLILTILFIIFKCLKRKIILKGGYIEDAENGNTYIRPINPKKNVNINGNSIQLKSNNNQLHGQELVSHLPHPSGHTYIRPGKKNHHTILDLANQIKLHSNHNIIQSNHNIIQSNNNQLQGQQLASHLPNSDGHTYIRPGKKNHDINLKDANKIILHSNNNIIHSNDNQLKGQELISHLPYSNGHTYIRPGKQNHNIYLMPSKQVHLTNHRIIAHDNGHLCIDGQCLNGSHFAKLRGLLNQHQLDRRYTHTIQPHSAHHRYALRKEGPNLVLRNLDAVHDSRWHVSTHGSLT